MAVTEINPVQAKPKKSALDIFAQTTGILGDIYSVGAAENKDGVSIFSKLFGKKKAK